MRSIWSQWVAAWVPVLAAALMFPAGRRFRDATRAYPGVADLLRAAQPRDLLFIYENHKDLDWCTGQSVSFLIKSSRESISSLT